MENLHGQKSTAVVRGYMDDYYAHKVPTTALPFNLHIMRETFQHVRTLCLPKAEEPGVRVLDVGCGGGGLRVRWPNWNTWGIDISAVAVQAARSKYPGGHFETCTIEESDRLKWGTFELVVATEVVEHLVDVNVGLAAMARATAPGGWLVLTTPNRDALHCRMARKMGFEAPLCCTHHTKEFGYQELIDLVCKHGFRHDKALGVMLTPWWTLEDKIGHALRKLTDNDDQVNEWMRVLGRDHPEFAFSQCHRFVRLP